MTAPDLSAAIERVTSYLARREFDGMRTDEIHAYDGVDNVLLASDVKRLVNAAHLSGWQPIETAPKDGTKILVYATRFGWEECGYQVVCAAWDGFSRWKIYGCAETRHWPQWLDECTPAHWMPLPAAPEREE